MLSFSPSASSESNLATLLPCLPSPPSMEPDLFNANSNSYYMVLRELFSRLVFSLGIESSLSMKIIAFLLWIEGNGHAGFLELINLFDDAHVVVLASSARTFVEALQIELTDPAGRSVSRSQFQREATEGISFYLNNVCYEALIDLHERAVRIHDMHQTYGESSNGRVPMSTNEMLAKIKALYVNPQNPRGEGTSSRNVQVQTSHILHQYIKEDIYDYQSTSSLGTLMDNLSLRETHNDVIMQQLSDVPRDERTLFVTFSNGYPLTKDELHDFFMRHYGDIEEISIEEPIEPRPPLYAQVTFFSQVTLLRVLDGNKRVKFMTRGKHLWARQFVPKKKKLRRDELNQIA